MTELTVENLHLDYGTNPVLKGVSMVLNKGEVVTLLGPSGSGKTTLLRAVAGLEKPSEGRITLGNRVIYEGSTGKEILVEDRNLGLVFQSYALWPHMTIFDNIAYPLKLRKVSSVEIKQRVQAVLDQLGLGNLNQRYPHQLSGGQQQRVSIGRGLIYNPPVLLLDEPLSNLDAKLREEARVFLRGLIVELNLSALMVTHDQNEAMAISDRILLLNNGVIEQQGTPQDMYAAPKSLFTAEFMGSNNRLNGQVCELKEGYVCIQGVGWMLWGKPVGDLTLNQEVTVIIRVEQVKLNDNTEVNSLERPLLTKMYLGSHWEYLFRESDESSPVLRAFSSDQHYEGVCRLSMPKDQVWVFART